MNNYIIEKINNFYSSYNPLRLINDNISDDIEMKKDWDQFKQTWTKQFANIRSEKDLYHIKSILERKIKALEGKIKLERRDFYNLYKILYCLCQTIEKFARNFDDEDIHVNISLVQTDMLFEDLFEYGKKINNLWNRMVCQY